MIKLEQVSKKFRSHVAVDNLSFELESGQITGFLGPNGAGKTTTMRMITGYLKPDSGRILVDGKTHEQASEAIRSNLGYLPETTPLYPDMSVIEHIELAAKVHGLGGAERKKAIGRILSVCGLTAHLKHIVTALSKGYRQRLGLALAMVHDPGVLILDEPTTGLDPNQIRDIKNLISELGARKTLLLSTHILHQAPELCDRIILINKGSLRFDGTPAEMAETMPRRNATLTVDQSPEQIIKTLTNIPYIEGVTHAAEEAGFHTYKLTGEVTHENLAHLTQFASERSWRVAACAGEPNNLDEVFAAMTREALPTREAMPTRETESTREAESTQEEVATS